MKRVSSILLLMSLSLTLLAQEPKAHEYMSLTLNPVTRTIGLITSTRVEAIELKQRNGSDVVKDLQSYFEQIEAKELGGWEFVDWEIFSPGASYICIMRKRKM